MLSYVMIFKFSKEKNVIIVDMLFFILTISLVVTFILTIRICFWLIWNWLIHFVI